MARARDTGTVVLVIRADLIRLEGTDLTQRTRHLRQHLSGKRGLRPGLVEAGQTEEDDRCGDDGRSGDETGTQQPSASRPAPRTRRVDQLRLCGSPEPRRVLRRVELTDRLADLCVASIRLSQMVGHRCTSFPSGRSAARSAVRALKSRDARVPGDTPRTSAADR